MGDSASEIFSTNLNRASFGEKSENTEMFGGLFVLLASWGFGGNILLCALIYQGNLWTMMNRGLMAVSVLGIFQSLFCLFPIGISGIREAWSFGDIWCSAYPFLYRFSQISLIYLIGLLLFYNIMGLKTNNNPSPALKTSSFWCPIVIFLLPYAIFLPPALVFLNMDLTSIQEDNANLNACTVVVNQDHDRIAAYRIFRAVETVFGLVLPYIGVAVLFGNLVALINQRKINKTTAVSDSFELEENADNKTATEVLHSEENHSNTPVIDHIPTGRRSPQHTMESLAARSDKQSEVVIYVLTATFVLFFAPYLYQVISELVDFTKITTERSELFRFLSHFFSFMVILVNPTIYTLQYPTIKESLLKRELLRVKGYNAQG